MGMLISKFDPKEFASKASGAISLSLKSKIKSLSEELNQLAEKLDAKPNAELFQQDFVESVTKKFHRLKSLDKIQLKAFTKKECKCLCLLACQIAKNEHDFAKIASILDENWRDSFIRSLLRFTLSNWNFLEKESIRRNENPLYRLFIRKLNQYDGVNYRICQWKKEKSFFKLRRGKEKSGSLEFFEACSSLPRLYDAPGILNLRVSDFCLEYFQKVICLYCKSRDVIAPDFEQLMAVHKNDNTQKIVIANYICDVQKKPKLDQKKIEHYALKMIGHPSQLYRWTIEGADSSTNELLESSRKKLNQWLIAKYIDEIFRGFMRDSSRKDFWMKYVDYISEIKIAGKDDVRREIEYSTTLKDTLHYYFIRMSRKGMNTCAFLMKIKDALIVEFSESNKGCVYIYREGMPKYNQMKQNFHAKQLTGSVDELFKEASFDYIKWYSSPKYGRLRHSTGWESSLSDWLQRELGINV